MSKNEIYEINKNIAKLKYGRHTNFITPNYLSQIRFRLRKDEYNVYYLYDDCDKVVLYTDELPYVRLFEIISYNSLKHSEILGSLFGLNICNEMFGDIVIYNDRYFVYLMNDVSEFVMDNLHMIGSNYVKLKEVPLNTLCDYKKQYEKYNIIVSSLRIDTVVSRIIGTSRDKIKNKIRNKEIMLNYDVLDNSSYALKEGDIFSIRKYGKYKFIGIIKTTKKDNYIVQYYKYI